MLDSEGHEIHLPTIWILDTCPIAAKSMRNWRWEEWADRQSNLTKENKNKPEQKFSHFNTVWEGIFKNLAFRPNSAFAKAPQRETPYFKGRR